MTITEMIQRKQELGYTNEQISKLSGVPLGTVMKIFGGVTKSPRHDTVVALEKVLKKPISYDMERRSTEDIYIRESAAAYAAAARPVNDLRTARYPRQGSYTIEDYYALPDDRRVELIDGVLYDMGHPRLNHESIVIELLVRFHACIRQHGAPCRVFASTTGVQLDPDDRTMVQPDILIVCDPEKYKEGNWIKGAPDLVVEVISPASRARDAVVKFRKYETAGVQEYWLIDPERKLIFVYVFGSDPLYESYDFNDTVPIHISHGSCSIDFSGINDALSL